MEAEISVVIPLLNEEANLRELHTRLRSALDQYGKTYEVLMVDDGSRDRSFEVLLELRESNPRLKIIKLRRNFGQHAATFAGFERAVGRYVVSMDADLQNAPEDIPKLLEKIKDGYDVVGGRRAHRKDSWLRRKIPSFLINRILARWTGLTQSDTGCFLKAYTNAAAKEIAARTEPGGFFTAVIGFLGMKYTEVDVSHAERTAGKSRYDIFMQLSMFMSLLTGYARRPFQTIELVGGLILLLGFGALAAGIVGIVPHQWIHWILYMQTALLGLTLGTLGVIGEFAIRIYYSVRGNPRYLVEKIVE